MLHSQGTISIVSGSAIVRGTGTKFISNINGVAPGQLMLIQSGSSNLPHMIQAVNSDTELVLADNASVTLNNVKYQIQTTVPDSISDGARHIVAINSYITQFLQNMDKWMSQNGTVAVTLPNGQTVSLQSIRALQAAMLDKNQNGADILDKTAFVNNIGAYPKTGGAINGAVITERLVTPSLLLGGSGGLEVGSQDAASFEGNNLEIRSWYGIGFRTTAGGQPTTIFFNTRTGDISTIGTIRAGNGVVMSLGQNCYSDGTGYIRPSSPIIQIYPDGKFITNDESEGATVTKLDTGHYQISGVLGYNADGAWGVHGGISSPKNNNGLELIYIDD
ncbi:tail fiber protein, partial [Xenorhabdus khoisanae]|uniref:phage tail fiber protein n=1 Tax=Xenorhabdus khoisanae TaxID=880157 RepID=UPI0023598980